MAAAAPTIRLPFSEEHRFRVLQELDLLVRQGATLGQSQKAVNGAIKTALEAHAALGASPGYDHWGLDRRVESCVRGILPSVRPQVLAQGRTAKEYVYDYGSIVVDLAKVFRNQAYIAQLPGVAAPLLFPGGALFAVAGPAPLVAAGFAPPTLPHIAPLLLPAGPPPPFPASIGDSIRSEMRKRQDESAWIFDVVPTTPVDLAFLAVLRANLPETVRLFGNNESLGAREAGLIGAKDLFCAVLLAWATRHVLVPNEWTRSISGGGAWPDGGLAPRGMLRLNNLYISSANHQLVGFRQRIDHFADMLTGLFARQIDPLIEQISPLVGTIVDLDRPLRQFFVGCALMRRDWDLSGTTIDVDWPTSAAFFDRSSMTTGDQTETAVPERYPWVYLALAPRISAGGCVAFRAVVLLD